MTQQSIVILTFLLCFKLSWTQTSFESKWTNPKYDTLINSADSLFDDADFTLAYKYYNDAFNLRPTEYAHTYLVITKSLIFHHSETLRTSEEGKYQQIVKVADSLFYSKNVCDASILYYLAKDFSKNEYPDSMLAKVNHPIHCDRVDKFYFKIITKADQYYQTKDFQKAFDLYKRGLILNPWDEYPQNQIELINKTVHNTK